MKRLLALFLTLVMLLSVFPASAFAEETPAEPEEAVEEVIAEAPAEAPEEPVPPAAEEVPDAPAEEILPEPAEEPIPAEDEDDSGELLEDSFPGLDNLLTHENFPDEIFYQYVLENHANVFGTLTTTDALLVTEIEAVDLGIKSVKGIELFTSLQTLSLWNNEISEINLDKNTHLTHLDLEDNNLKSVSLSRNTRLVSVCLNGNPLSSLDVSRNTALVRLSATNCGLSSIDLSKNTKLEHLSLDLNKLSSIDLSKNVALTDISLFDNRLETIDLSKNTRLLDLNLCYNNFSAINLSNNPSLIGLVMTGNALSSIDLSKNIALSELYLAENLLESIDLSKNTALTAVELGNNLLTSVDLSRNTALTDISLPENSIRTLVLPDAPGLAELVANDNELESIDVSGFPVLQNLMLYNNCLTAIDVSGNPELYTLALQGNSIFSIDLSKNTLLVSLNLADNELRSLDLSKNVNLEYLYIQRNHLLVIDLIGNMKLFETNCDFSDQTLPYDITCWRSDSSNFFVIDLGPLFPDITYEQYVKMGILYCNFGMDYKVSGNLVSRSTNYRTFDDDDTCFPYMEFACETGCGATMYSVLEPQPVSLGRLVDQDYILLGKGDTFAIDTQRIPEVLRPYLRWAAYEYKMVPVADPETGRTMYEYEEKTNAECVSIDTSGLIRAVDEGTAFVCAYLDFDDYDALSNYEYPCFCEVRIDVAANGAKDVITASLPEKTAAVNLYSTDYASVEVLLERQELLKTAAAAVLDEGMIPAPLNQGVTIESASFTDETLNAMFRLDVKDDGRLLIVPNDATITAGKSGKYVSRIALRLSGLDDPVVTADKLTMTVKATMPKLKATAVKLNSLQAAVSEGYVYSIRFTGGKVSGYEVAGAPAWLGVDTGSMLLSFTGNPGLKASGKLNLNCSVEGYAVKVPVTVSVSCASTAPKLTLGAKSVSMNAAGDFCSVGFSTTGYEFMNHVTVKKIVDGKKSYTPDDFPGFEVFVYSGYSDELGIYGNVSFDTKYVRFDDGKDHSCKVVLELFGKEYPVTVKLTGSPKKTPYIEAKISGSIDLSVPYSPVSVILTAKNRSFMENYIEFEVRDETTGEDVTDMFEAVCGDWQSAQTGKLNLSLYAWETYDEATGIELMPSHTYRVYFSWASDYDWNFDEASYMYGEPISGSAKLPVKCSALSKVVPSVTAKAVGKLDTMTGEGLRITTSFKNFYVPGYEYYQDNIDELDYIEFTRLIIYRTYNADTRSKTRELVYDSAIPPVNPYDYLFYAYDAKDRELEDDWYVYMNYELNPADKFTAKVEYCYRDATADNPGIMTYLESKEVPFTVTRGKAKLSCTAGDGTISSKDRFDTVRLDIRNKGEKCYVSYISLDDAAYRYFTLERDDDTESFFLRWRDNLLPANIAKLAGKTITVKASIGLSGAYPADKTDGTVTLKIKVV